MRGGFQKVPIRGLRGVRISSEVHDPSNPKWKGGESLQEGLTAHSLELKGIE